MNDTTPPGDSYTALEKKVASLAFAMKFSLLALLFGVSFFNIRTTFYIPRFQLIYQDILGFNTPLPWDTTLVIAARTWLAGLSCALPAVGLFALFVKARSAGRPVIAISICLLIAVLQYTLIWWALAAPIVRLIQNMSSDGSGMHL